MGDRMSRAVTGRVLLAGALAAALFTVVTYNSTRWIGRTFPGFFVMANGVIPSSALPDWFDTDAANLFQHQVVAVDAVPVVGSAQVYEAVRGRPAGTAFRYTLRAPDGILTTCAIQSRIFSGTDYLLIFGSFLLCGAAFVAAGLLVFALRPTASASVGLLSAGLAIGVFALTAVDLYGPHWFFRVHVFAECMASAGLMHLALVFPTDRLRHRRRGSVLLAVYLPFAVLAVVYESVLYMPSAYSAAHLVASMGHGLAGLSIIAAVVYDLLTTHSVLVRRRIGVVAFGTISAFLLPTLVMAGSGLLGGSVAVNWASLTAFVFPISIGYAIVKQDLFEIDVFLRRAITYALVVVTVSSAYLVALFVFGSLVPARELLSQSAAAKAVLNLGVLLVIAPTHRRAQDCVDRVFFRKSYDAGHALSVLSESLASARTTEDVVTYAQQVIGQALCPASSTVFVAAESDGKLRELVDGILGRLAVPTDAVARLVRGDVLARYEWDDGSGRSIPAFFTQLDAELMLPVRSGDALLGIVVLGAKQSGRAYSAHDVAFLRTLANQVALAMRNAAAFTQLGDLNLSLEGQVAERTAALERTNNELNRSLAELRNAYQQLERSQASLLRADRLATLGRLTASIAHEMNTPLGAVLSSLKILSELGREYLDSIDDPHVLAGDHRQIAQEIVSTAAASSAWAMKAAAFISKVKIHGREHPPAAAARFAVRGVVEEITALLAHRLRATSCHIDFNETPAGVVLTGSAPRFSQVLVNLMNNAIDAYEDAGIDGGRIEVRARHDGEHTIVTLRDEAGGIRPDVLPRIFDELFTTKEPGRGTGLGLWIARNLVEESFGGTLTVTSSPRVGTCFTATFPVTDQSNDRVAPEVRLAASGLPSTPALN